MRQPKEHLMALARSGLLSHAYILEGKNGEKKAALAWEFALAITPYKEDLIGVKADGFSIRDKAIDELQDRLSMKPFVGDRLVAILDDADTMTPRAQNRLLKTLEEPKGKAVILLLAENVLTLLPTLRSRCVILRTDPSEGGEEQFDEEIEEVAAQVGKQLLAGGRFYTIVKMMEPAIVDREQALYFIDALLRWIRQLLRRLILEGRPSSEDQMVISCAARVAHAAEEARRDLNRYIKPGYALKGMVLNLIQEEQ